MLQLSPRRVPMFPFRTMQPLRRPLFLSSRIRRRQLLGARYNSTQHSFGFLFLAFVACYEDLAVSSSRPFFHHICYVLVTRMHSNEQQPTLSFTPTLPFVLLATKL